MSYDLTHRIENVSPHKNVYKHGHCSIIHNHQRVKTTLAFISGWMENQKVVYQNDGILCNHKKERSTHTSYNMDKPWKHGKWKKTVIKAHILYDSICNVQKRQIKETEHCRRLWLGVAGNREWEDGGWLAKEYSVSFWGDKNVLKLTMVIYL